MKIINLAFDRKKPPKSRQANYRQLKMNTDYVLKVILLVCASRPNGTDKSTRPFT